MTVQQDQTSTSPYVMGAGRLGAMDTSTVANIVDSAQLGFGAHVPSIDGATPLVLRPIVPIVMHTPTMFDAVPNFSQNLKALVERCPISIDGIDPHLTIEAQSVPIGHDGQELFMPTNARREQLNPSFTFPDFNGMLTYNLFRYWQWMIKDPDTQASSLAGVIAPGTTLAPHVMSMFTMDVLFIQYDTTLQPQNIIDAYFITNMWPNDIGTPGFKLENATSEVPRRTINFYGVLQMNRNTRLIGQSVAEVLGLHLKNYDYATPAATQIESKLSDMGVQREISNIASSYAPLNTNDTALPT